jgi:hypothetical protein
MARTIMLTIHLQSNLNLLESGYGTAILNYIFFRWWKGHVMFVQFICGFAGPIINTVNLFQSANQVIPCLERRNVL